MPCFLVELDEKCIDGILLPGIDGKVYFKVFVAYDGQARYIEDLRLRFLVSTYFNQQLNHVLYFSGFRDMVHSAIENTIFATTFLHVVPLPGSLVEPIGKVIYKVEKMGRGRSEHIISPLSGGRE